MVLWDRTAAPPLPACIEKGTSRIASTTLGDGRAVLVGGASTHQQSEILCTVWDENRRSWLDMQGSHEGDVPPSLVGHTAVAGPDGNSVLVFGGQDPQGVKTGDMYRGWVSPGFESMTWRTIALPPPPPAVPVEPHPPAKGKRKSDHAIQEVPKSQTPPARAFHCASQAEKDGQWCMIIYGGVSSSGQYLNDLWSYSADLDKWTDITPPANPNANPNANPSIGVSPPALAHGTLTAVEGGKKLVLVGGYDGKSAVSIVAVLSFLPQPSWTVLTDSGIPEICMHAATSVLDLPADALAPLNYQPSGTADTASSTRQGNVNLWSSSSEAVVVYGGVGLTGLLPYTAMIITSAGVAYELKTANGNVAPPPRGSACVTRWLNDTVLMSGGFDDHGRCMRDCFILDPAASTLEESEYGLGTEKPPMEISYENGDFYAGALTQEGKRQGSGTCTYANKDVYTGEWVNDMRHGRGEFICNAGGASPLSQSMIKYVGEWQDDIPKGIGEGTFCEPQNAGAGAMTTLYLSSYSGEWNGQPQGQGRGTFFNGKGIYTGRWSGLHPDGEGTWEEGGGRVVEGSWKTGALVEGREKSATRLGGEYEGEFQNLKRHGQGKLRYADGSTFQGSFRNGRQNGYGDFVCGVTRQEYHGKFVGGLRCGAGTCKYAAGHTYIGEWQADQRHGKGKMIYVSGDVYTGGWQADKRWGEGTITKKDGSSQRGLWRNDELLRELPSV